LYSKFPIENVNRDLPWIGDFIQPGIRISIGTIDATSSISEHPDNSFDMS
jgi:hypothetical protein